MKWEEQKASSTKEEKEAGESNSDSEIKPSINKDFVDVGNLETTNLCVAERGVRERVSPSGVETVEYLGESGKGREELKEHFEDIFAKYNSSEEGDSVIDKVNIKSSESKQFIANNELVKIVLRQSVKAVDQYCEKKGFHVSHYTVETPSNTEAYNEKVLQIVVRLNKDFESFEEALKVQDEMVKRAFNRVEQFKKRLASPVRERELGLVQNTMSLLLAGINSLPVQTPLEELGA